MNRIGPLAERIVKLEDYRRENRQLIDQGMTLLEQILTRLQTLETQNAAMADTLNAHQADKTRHTGK